MATEAQSPLDEWRPKTLADGIKTTNGVTYVSADYSSEDSGNIFLTIKCFAKGGGFNPEGIKYFRGTFLPEQQLEAGELIVAKTDLTRAGDIIGSPMLVPAFGIAKKVLPSMDLCVLRPYNEEIDRRFLFYRLMLFDARQFMRAHSAGSTVLHLESSALPRFGFRIPDPSKQRLIREILSRVDDLIAKTEAVIAKLRQVRAGLLHDLLNRGVDLHGQLRDPIAHPDQFQASSLGRIPKDWTVRALKECYEIPSRNGLYKKASCYGFGHRMIHMPQMFKGVFVDVDDAVLVDVDPQELQRYALQEGDILFARRSLNLEGAGLCSMVSNLRQPATFESSIVRVRVKRDMIVPRFAVEFLRSPAGYLLRRRFIRQVAVSGVSSEDIANFLVPCPKAPEQECILSLLDIKDTGIRLAEQEAGKLVQLKSGLMNDLLTGRVRVPEIVH